MPSATVPRRVKLLILTQVINTLSFGYFLIYLTAYLTEINSASYAGVVGAILGVEGIVVICAGIPFGILSDRWGRKWFLIVGNLLMAPTILVFALTMDVALLLLAAVIGGVAEALSLSSWNAIIADQTDLGNRDAAFSLSFIVSNVFLSLGMALPLAFPILEVALGIGSTPMHMGSLFLLGLANFASPVLIIILLKGYEERIAPVDRASRSSDMKLVLKFSGMNGIIGLGAGLIIPLMGTWLWLKFTVPDNISGPFLAVAGMTIAFSAVGSARLSARLGRLRAMLLATGSSVPFMLSLALIPNVFLAGGVYIVRAALMNMSAPLMDSFVMSIAPQMRGLASSISAIVWRLPNSISTILGGLILASGQYDLPWLLASILYVVGIGLIYTYFKNVKPRG